MQKKLCYKTMNKPSILITGSSGRIGSAIAVSLQRNFNIIGIDLVPEKASAKGVGIL